MCLTNAKRGQVVQIVKITDANIRSQFIRFGIGEGSQVTCLEKIPFGPFTLRHNRQEIAVGHEVAKTIFVKEEVLS